MDPNGFVDEKCENRLYIGNLDFRITEAALIKMFSPFGTIVSEQFLWHTHGPNRGKPRGSAFVQYSTREEAELAKEKMHGRLVCSRPLIVSLANDRYFMETQQGAPKAMGAASSGTSSGSGQGTSKSAKIAAIKNKLKALEGESSTTAKKLRPSSS